MIRFFCQYLTWIIHEHIKMLNTAKPWNSFLEFNRIFPQKMGRLPLWSLIKLLWNYQGTLIVAIPTVRPTVGYFPMLYRTPFYKDSCYTVWTWQLLLNGLPLQQSLSALSVWCPPVAFAYWLAVPVVWTNWISCRQAYEVSYGWHLLLWNDCWQQQNQTHFCLP